MKKYALVILPSEDLRSKISGIVDGISEKFGSSGAKMYPPHIPLKYGFMFENEVKLKKFVDGFNSKLTEFTVKVSGANIKSGAMIFLGVNDLGEVKTKLYDSMKSDLGFDEFRDIEVVEDYKFHLTVAEGNLTTETEGKIVEFIRGEISDFEFVCSKIEILVFNDKFEILE